MTEDGVAEITTLLSKHESELSSFGRQQVVAYVVEADGSVTESGQQVLTVASDDAALRFEYVERGDLPESLRAPITGLWTTDEESAIRTGEGEDAAVETHDYPQDRPPMDATSRIGRALGDARLLGVKETEDGPLTWLRSTGRPHRAAGLADATAYEAVGTVRRRGAVVSLRERAEARDGGRGVAMTTTNRFTAIGETTVKRPAWAGG